MADLDGRRLLPNVVANYTPTPLWCQRPPDGCAIFRGGRLIPRPETGALVRRALCDAWPDHPDGRPAPRRRPDRDRADRPSTERWEAGPCDVHLQLLRRIASRRADDKAMSFLDAARPTGDR